MNSLIEEWQKQKKNRQKAHKQFVKRLEKRKSKALSKLGEELHENVFSEVSCLDCANCCTSIPPMASRADISRIAKHLGMSKKEFEIQYLKIDEDGDKVINQTPCPFLQSDNACLIYDVRPQACRKYPHTDNYEFAQHLNLHAQNSFYCPAVFHILERMENLT